MARSGPFSSVSARVEAGSRPAPSAPATEARPAPVPALSHDNPILIAGGGIGGLATAIALAVRGIDSNVLERRAEFGEVGAGIQIGPNGVRVLQALGVADVLSAQVGRPVAIAIRDGLTARPLATLPLGRAIEARHGAPYWTAHRADLHLALLNRARQFPQIAFTMGFDARRASSADTSVRVRAADGAALEGAALVAADGLWSSLRQHVMPGFHPAYANRRAYRAVIPSGAAPAGLEGATVTGLWLAPGAHVVHYPVRGGTEIAIVVIIASREPGEGWNAVAAPGDVRAQTDRLAAPLRDLIAAAHAWGAWSLQGMPRLPRWSRGRVALLGDAAHPMLPFLAQGAVMALEDAMVVAGLLSRCTAAPGQIEAAFKAYELARRSRVYRVVDAASRNGHVYHLSGPAATARDLVLRASPGARLIAGYDWLYGFKILA